jgi:hypothetical protein
MSSGVGSERDRPQIVEGPTPHEYGDVVFVVRIGERRVPVYVDRFGVGVGEADLDLHDPAVTAVSSLRKAEPDAFERCLREAARLRHVGGYPPRFDVAVPASLIVSPEPRLAPGVTWFGVKIRESSFEVLVTADGMIGDNYEWEGGLEVPEVESAYRAVLNHIFRNAERASAWGLDLETLRLFWT